MTISKLEGDAVFVYAPEEVFACSETLIDFIESMSVAFRDKQLSVKARHHLHLQCLPQHSFLDLKFFIHCGDYI